MKRAMRAIPLTQEHDYIGEFHMATKKQIYNHMKQLTSQALKFCTSRNLSIFAPEIGMVSRVARE